MNQSTSKFKWLKI